MFEARVAHRNVSGDRKRVGRATRDDRRIDEAADGRKPDDVHALQDRVVFGNGEAIVRDDGPAGARRDRAFEPERAGEQRAVVAREKKRSEFADAVFVDVEKTFALTVRAVGIDRAVRAKAVLAVAADQRVAANRFARGDLLARTEAPTPGLRRATNLRVRRSAG